MVQYMRSLQKHGLYNHPEISAEYVLFLETNFEIGDIRKIKTTVASLVDKLRDIGKTLDDTKNNTCTASNKADEAKNISGGESDFK